jgi:hypothetical protein
VYGGRKERRIEFGIVGMLNLNYRGVSPAPKAASSTTNERYLKRLKHHLKGVASGVPAIAGSNKVLL